MPGEIRLTWDAWNETHIARHDVTPDEVDEVCRGEPVTLEGHDERILVIGQTSKGRLLAAILDPEPAGSRRFYPVAARPASRRERRLYRTVKGDNET